MQGESATRNGPRRLYDGDMSTNEKGGVDFAGLAWKENAEDTKPLNKNKRSTSSSHLSIDSLLSADSHYQSDDEEPGESQLRSSSDASDEDAAPMVSRSSLLLRPQPEGDQEPQSTASSQRAESSWLHLDLALSIFSAVGPRRRRALATVSRWFNEVVSYGRIKEIFVEKEPTVAATGSKHVVIFQEHKQLVLTAECGEGAALEALPALRGEQVQGISADKHVVVCTKAGEVFTWGDGADFRLGHGTDAAEEEPRKVARLHGQRVVDVAAGGRHSACCTHSGTVLTFGDGSEGQLGHGTAQSEQWPRAVLGLRGWRIMAVAAGDRHTVCLSTDGTVFTFGSGAWGVLGHGGQAQEDSPRMVEGLCGVQGISVAAGALHTLLATADGRVYSWGYGAHGRLGHGGDSSKSQPVVIEALKGRHVVGISAGDAHSAVLTECGEVLTFGLGLSGRLGHEGTRTERSPRGVERLKDMNVCAVAAGYRHTVVTTSDGNVAIFGCMCGRGLREL